MNSQDEQFLNLKTFPARVRVEEAALLLGFSVHEIPILMAHGMMKPLGHPPLTGVKFFSVASLEELRRDERWLAKASDCIVEYWRDRNEKKNAARGGRKHHAPRGGGNDGLKRRFPFAGVRLGQTSEATAE
ncbi:MAG TPA: hypothetical protein VH280_21960 [Verrucomicrobiae bacterium]|jgi:hypothetical protein|nr:hypothetical protein [Verrucomicrobiae bacterium]